ncbi:hypothetical protein Tco_0322904 [Tanacetum coccineum]
MSRHYHRSSGLEVIEKPYIEETLKNQSIIKINQIDKHKRPINQFHLYHEDVSFDLQVIDGSIAVGQRSIPVTSKNSVDAPSESSRGLQLNYRFSCCALKAAEADVQKIKFEDIYCSQVIGPLISCCKAAWIRVDLFSRMLQSSDYGVSREFSSEDDNIVHLIQSELIDATDRAAPTIYYLSSSLKEQNHKQQSGIIFEQFDDDSNLGSRVTLSSTDELERVNASKDGHGTNDAHIQDIIRFMYDDGYDVIYGVHLGSLGQVKRRCNQIGSDDVVERYAVDIIPLRRVNPFRCHADELTKVERGSLNRLK